jgi:hypothetical protein
MDMADLAQQIDKFVGWVHEVNHAMAGATHLLTALATFVTAVTGRVVSGRPIVPPASPGQPRPRLFSPKAILKGWIVTLLAFVILGFLAGAYLGSLVPGNLSPQEYQYRFWEFVGDPRGRHRFCDDRPGLCVRGLPGRETSEVFQADPRVPGRRLPLPDLRLDRVELLPRCGRGIRRPCSPVLEDVRDRLDPHRLPYRWDHGC